MEDPVLQYKNLFFIFVWHILVSSGVDIVIDVRKTDCVEFRSFPWFSH